MSVKHELCHRLLIEIMYRPQLSYDQIFIFYLIIPTCIFMFPLNYCIDNSQPFEYLPLK